jgi:hypothetical protein
MPESVATAWSSGTRKVSWHWANRIMYSIASARSDLEILVGNGLLSHEYLAHLGSFEVGCRCGIDFFHVRVPDLCLVRWNLPIQRHMYSTRAALFHSQN